MRLQFKHQKFQADAARAVEAKAELSARTDAGEADRLTRRMIAVFSAAVNRPETEISGDSDFFLDLGGSSLDYFAMLRGWDMCRQDALSGH